MSLLLLLGMYCASSLDALIILGRQYRCPLVEFSVILSLQVKDMAKQGFTRLANDMASKGPYSYHSLLSDRVHCLNKEIIPQCVELLRQESNPALAGMIAAINKFRSY